MKSIAAAIVATLPIGPALAAEGKVSSDGVEYTMTDNQHGFVLTRPGEKIYLGVSCDAFSTVSGSGQWDWANGGFCVSLAKARICFPRQEVGDGSFSHDISQCMM